MAKVHDKTNRSESTHMKTPAATDAAQELADAVMARWKPADLVEFVSQQLREQSDPKRAVQMAAYMKTDMPFYGVQKPGRVPVYRDMKRRFPVRNASQYRSAIAALWALPHREEKYAAIELARTWNDFISPSALPLYRRLIVEGAWWDFVDAIASDLVGGALAKSPGRVFPTMDKWIDDDDMWVRRSALLCQLKLKEATDAKRLFGYCLARCDEQEFFIRKAIGWALRQYSYTDPQSVREFLVEHRDRLSPLSFREGAKQLKRIDMAP